MSATPSGVLRLKVLDVGEGDAIILLLPDCTRAIVVDAFDGERIVETLEEEGVDEVILFLSHSDNDHVAGVVHLLDNFRGHFIAFFYNMDRIDASLRSKYRMTLLALSKATKEMAVRDGLRPFSGSFNTNLNDMSQFSALVSPPVCLEVLHPEYHDQSAFIGTTTNEGAGVLRVTHTNTSGDTWAILLAADVQLTGISCIMHRFSADPSKLQANILKFPHHGAWPTTFPGISQFAGMPRRTMGEFLEAVDPQLVILSVGFDNPHQHVRPPVFAALRDLAAKKKRLRRILCTQFTDTCLHTKGTCRPPHCAGDVEIRIGGGAHGGIEVLPQGTAHAGRILAVTDLAHAGCGHLL